ncbi:hypothetical protein GCM10010215_17900 [Streptomyces virginiae]|uniref:Uncharacterized protein n=1 Tax=Streptomyces virginiae TaxID=1961 RepID=A0ABQ3NX88_STRVG|nr:hypothetical protein [Streptomyces virginiae]GGP92549.1 hypothetical protein GCM10010215_17900 [Streptomyces virginiae]GHI17395.1 hypothetical protein Scinn_68580 [Streptomyces virginiae]
MPGHPVHPDQPAQPTQSVHFPDPGAHFAASPRQPLHPSVQPSGRPHDDPAGDVVRWAAFSCLLVPVVLVVYGTSVGGAAVATLGLFVVTAACLVLLRQSERAAARVRAEERPASAHRRRHSRGGTASRRGCRTSDSASPHD